MKRTHFFYIAIIALIFMTVDPIHQNQSYGAQRAASGAVKFTDDATSIGRVRSSSDPTRHVSSRRGSLPPPLQRSPAQLRLVRPASAGSRRGSLQRTEGSRHLPRPASAGSSRRSSLARVDSKVTGAPKEDTSPIPRTRSRSNPPRPSKIERLLGPEAPSSAAAASVGSPADKARRLLGLEVVTKNPVYGLDKSADLTTRHRVQFYLGKHDVLDEVMMTADEFRGPRLKDNNAEFELKKRLAVKFRAVKKKLKPNKNKKIANFDDAKKAISEGNPEFGIKDPLREDWNFTGEPGSKELAEDIETALSQHLALRMRTKFTLPIEIKALKQGANAAEKKGIIEAKEDLLKRHEKELIPTLKNLFLQFRPKVLYP